MNTVLVTIVGPGGRADAAAPSNSPLYELLPIFAQMTTPGTGQGDWERWTARPGAWDVPLHELAALLAADWPHQPPGTGAPLGVI